MDPWWRTAVPEPDQQARRAAQRRQGELTKPPGSLGRLERLAVDLAALQGRDRPRLDRVHIAVFAADHGIAAEGVSAFPQAVTLEMVRNFARGGAAISVLARQLGAGLDVVDVGTAVDGGPLDGVVSARVGAGTASFRAGSAMSAAERDQALEVGRAAVRRALEGGANAFVGGEMGIGNTTTATALAAALLQCPPRELIGPGTGLDDAGVALKLEVIEAALAHHGPIEQPFEALMRLGGFEIAALAGAFIAGAQARLPVLVDGFIASAAALTAVREVPAIRPWLLATHRSAEPGHARLLEVMELEPLVDLGMRLGEGSGAAVAVPLLRAACALHGEMATFAEAGVSREDAGK